VTGTSILKGISLVLHFSETVVELGVTTSKLKVSNSTLAIFLDGTVTLNASSSGL